MEGCSLLSLVDTGSQINCINKMLIDKLDLWQSVKLAKGVSLLGVGNNPVQNFGTITLTVKFVEDENLKFVDTFYIVGNLSVDAIFGYDFLLNHNGIINTKNPPCLQLSDVDQIKVPIVYPRQEMDAGHCTFQVSGLYKLDEKNYNYKPIKGCDLRKPPPRIVHTTALGNNELLTVLRKRRELIEGNNGHLNVSIPKGGSPLNNSKQYGQLPQPHFIYQNEVIIHEPTAQPAISHIPLVKTNPSISRSCNVNNLNASDHKMTKTISFKTPVKYVTVNHAITTPPPEIISYNSTKCNMMKTMETKNSVMIDYDQLNSGDNGLSCKNGNLLNFYYVTKPFEGCDLTKPPPRIISRTIKRTNVPEAICNVSPNDNPHYARDNHEVTIEAVDVSQNNSCNMKLAADIISRIPNLTGLSIKNITGLSVTNILAGLYMLILSAAYSNYSLNYASLPLATPHKALTIAEYDSKSESGETHGMITLKPHVPGKRRNELELLLHELTYVIGENKIYERDLILPPARNLRPSKPLRTETMV